MRSVYLFTDTHARRSDIHTWRVPIRADNDARQQRGARRPPASTYVCLRSCFIERKSEGLERSCSSNAKIDFFPPRRAATLGRLTDRDLLSIRVLLSSSYRHTLSGTRYIKVIRRRIRMKKRRWFIGNLGNCFWETFKLYSAVIYLNKIFF